MERSRRTSTNVGEVQKDVNQRGNITNDKQGKDKLWGMIAIHPDNDLMQGCRYRAERILRVWCNFIMHD